MNEPGKITIKISENEIIKQGAIETYKELAAANDCIIEILNSYMEFVGIMELTLKNVTFKDEKHRVLAEMLIKRRRADWKPVLQHCLEHKEKSENSACK